jgi:hypothetical protein
MAELDTNKLETMVTNIIENSPNPLLIDESVAAAYMGIFLQVY